eukprot:scpid19888/ scgid12111/ 
MADLNSFLELPHRNGFEQFQPARDAHIRERPSVIRESRSGAVLQALMDMQDQLRQLQNEKSSLNQRFEELTEETSRYRSELEQDRARLRNVRSQHSREEPSSPSLVQQLEEARLQLERARVGRHRQEHRARVHNVILDDDNEGNSDDDADESSADSGSDSGVDEPHRSHHSSAHKPAARPKQSAPFQNGDGRHYRLNLAHIPFVVGQSTAPSHSVGGSLQQVLAELKRHHPVICDRVSSRARRRHHDGNQPEHCARNTVDHDDCCSRSAVASRAKQAKRHGPSQPHEFLHARSESRLAANRQVLRDMRTLKCVLHKDDVRWT